MLELGWHRISLYGTYLYVYVLGIGDSGTGFIDKIINGNDAASFFASDLELNFWDCLP